MPSGVAAHTVSMVEVARQIPLRHPYRELPCSLYLQVKHNLPNMRRCPHFVTGDFKSHHKVGSAWQNPGKAVLTRCVNAALRVYRSLLLLLLLLMSSSLSLLGCCPCSSSAMRSTVWPWTALLKSVPQLCPVANAATSFCTESEISQTSTRRHVQIFCLWTKS